MIYDTVSRWWAAAKCAAGFHPWAEENRWVGPATYLGVTGPVDVENAVQGIDSCPLCGERQHFLVNDEGGKDFPTVIPDYR